MSQVKPVEFFRTPTFPTGGTVYLRPSDSGNPDDVSSPTAPNLLAQAPAVALRERIAQEISEVDGHAGSVEPYGDATYEQMADAALAVVAPELERLTAEVKWEKSEKFEAHACLGRFARGIDQALGVADLSPQDAAKAVAELKRERDESLAEVSRLREQLATQQPADLVERAALWLFRAKTSRLMPDVLQRASMTWHRVLDQQDRDAWISYAREMLADLGWSAPVSESVPATPQHFECPKYWDDPANECSITIDGVHGCMGSLTTPHHSTHCCACGATPPESLRASARSAATPEAPSSSPTSGGDSDTTPRVWPVDSPEPDGTGLRVRGDVNEVVFERREVVHNPARWRALPPEGDGGYYSWRSLNHELHGDAQSFTEVLPSLPQEGGTDGQA